MGHHESGGGEFHSIAYSRKMVEQPVNAVVDVAFMAVFGPLFALGINTLVQSGKTDGGGGGHGHGGH